jgi:IS1 family transposase
MSVEAIVKRFAVCGRCSFFVAGYKLLMGNEHWETAVNQIDGRWLRLAWTAEVGRLAGHSFGARLDISCFHYESRCPECGRSFQYRAADNKELMEPLFQIEL